MDASEDCISGLPDELLHTILVRLGSTRAAVRTGVLSRRWRHVWASLPELVLEERVDAPPPPPASFLGTVNAALAACGASSRVFASLRSAWWGRSPSTCLRGCCRSSRRKSMGEEAAVLELPASGVTRMDGGACRLRAPSSGLFGKLTNLVIFFARMEGSATSQPSCARNAHAVLQCLHRSFQSYPGSTPPTTLGATTSNDVGHRLRLLELDQNSTVASLMQQFDEVGKLKLDISIPQGIAGYESFLNATNKLPKCKILSISSAWQHHGLVPGLLHLLRSCDSTRKLVVDMFVQCIQNIDMLCKPFDQCDSSDSSDCSSLAADLDSFKKGRSILACHLAFVDWNRVTGLMLFLSIHLKEVVITSYTSSHEVLEFVEQLSKCNVAILKKVVMKHKMNSAPPPTKEVREKICRMFQPNIEFELYVFSDWKWVRRD